MFWVKDKFSDEFLNFEDFCISESLKPIPIDFGTDLKNGKWYINESPNVLWTFFRYEKYFYCVMLDTNKDVGFATSEFFDKDKLKNISYTREFFDFDERKTSSASKVFSYVFYILLTGVKTFNISEFKFSGQHPALGKVYKRMVKNNKYFLDSVEKAGFELVDDKNDEFIFKRKEIV